MRKKPMKVLCFLMASLTSFAALGAEREVTAPDGRLAVVVSDEGGLNYRVKVNGAIVVTNSSLGLTFRDNIQLGPAATIKKASTRRHRGTWENRFGNRRSVPDNYRELRLTLEERGSEGRTFGLIVRAYDDGVAFRYDLPETSRLGQFVMTEELTEFRFAGDYRCWAGRESASAENQYPETRLSAIPQGRPGRPHQSVLPLLVETPAGYLAVAESDVLDWSGMSLTGTGESRVKAVLERRTDRNGVVVSAVPRVSPWRVLIFGPTAAELAGSDLVATLATPSRLKNTSWIKPGPSAWDAWWTGINPYDPDPRHRNVEARGTTPSHKEYIDLAAKMGWPYQLMDWYWYEGMTSYNKSLHSAPNPVRGDFRKVVPAVDIPELVQYAKSKNVRLLIWAHSLDVKTFGMESALEHLASLGFAGVKIDFFNSQSQETVQWCEKVMEVAAKHRLLINLHGIYKPTGLSRTYPNFVTQEGVLGNEYNKLPGNQCTPQHAVTMPFTRALLGPMDYTPGGFLNRAPKDFRISVPAQVMGSRAHQLAMPVIYPSPLTVFCDSPTNYHGQPGLDFLRNMPTVWDDTVVISGEVGKNIVMARRSGERWYLGAMTGNDASKLNVPLSFLRRGKWKLAGYADVPGDSNYEAVRKDERVVDSKTSLQLELIAAGGYVAVIERER